MPVSFVLDTKFFPPPRLFMYIVFLDTKLLIILELQTAVWLAFGYAIFQLKTCILNVCFPKCLGKSSFPVALFLVTLICFIIKTLWASRQSIKIVDKMVMDMEKVEILVVFTCETGLWEFQAL